MEEESKRINRELIEFLNEVRVVLPGLSVLFAFLLTVPFTDRFDVLDETHHRIFAALFLVTLAALVLMTAPSAFHRLQFRERDKEALLRYSNRCMIIGMVLMATSLMLAAYLLVSMIFDATAAWIAGALTGVLIMVVWFLVPLSRKQRN